MSNCEVHVISWLRPVLCFYFIFVLLSFVKTTSEVQIVNACQFDNKQKIFMCVVPISHPIL